MLSQVSLSGPNKAPIVLRVEGTVKAYSDVQKLPNKRAEWITFRHINAFTLTGGGVFDGNGHDAWKAASACKSHRNCIRLPIVSIQWLSSSFIREIKNITLTLSELELQFHD